MRCFKRILSVFLIVIFVVFLEDYSVSSYAQEDSKSYTETEFKVNSEDDLPPPLSPNE